MQASKLLAHQIPSIAYVLTIFGANGKYFHLNPAVHSMV